MALPVIVLAIAAGGLVMLVLYLQDLNRWVDHTDVVIGRVNKLQKLTAEREAELRGYLLTHDQRLLDGYNASDALMSPLFDELQDLVADHAEQIARLRAARVEVIRYRHYAAQQVDRVRDGASPEKTASFVRAGTEIGERIRASLRDFTNAEEALRRWRVHRADEVTWYALMSGVVLSLLVGTAVAFATARQMKHVRARYTEALDVQKHAELSLRESEEQLRLAKDAAGMGTWDWNIGTGEIAWSERCKALFGLLPDTVMSYDVFLASVHPDDRSRVDAAVRLAIADGTGYDVEMRVPWHDGSIRWVATKGRAFYDAEGHPLRMTGMALDITARKRNEEALAEADRRKDEFLGALSHELRNPLAPIRNAVYVLEHAGASSEQAARARSVIARQVDHLARLVDDLLDVKRLSVGKMRLRRDRMDLAKLAAETAEDLRPLMVERKLALEVIASSGPVWIHGDWTRMAQVVGNLLQNAAKFTDPGGHVSVEVASRHGSARLVVRDDGVGMAPEVLGKLFDPFVQAETTLERSHGGLGLGLALVRGIVEIHGGSVTARSGGVGKGTEFEIELPSIDSASDDAAEDRAPTLPVRPRRVLVIEDNEDVADSLRDLLELEGHEVHVARDGGSGVEAAKALVPDVVLCDLGLPVLDGYGVARQLRAGATPGRPLLVALSGYASSDDVQRSRVAGFDQHLAKPPDVDVLLRIVSECVSCAAA